MKRGTVHPELPHIRYDIFQTLIRAAEALEEVHDDRYSAATRS